MISYKKTLDRDEWLSLGYTKQCAARAAEELMRAEVALVADALESSDPKVAVAAAKVKHLQKTLELFKRTSS